MYICIHIYIYTYINTYTKISCIKVRTYKYMHITDFKKYLLKFKLNADANRKLQILYIYIYM